MVKSSKGKRDVDRDGNREGCKKNCVTKKKGYQTKDQRK